MIGTPFKAHDERPQVCAGRWWFTSNSWGLASEESWWWRSNYFSALYFSIFLFHFLTLHCAGDERYNLRRVAANVAFELI